MIVLDSSAAVEWLLGLPLAEAVSDRIVSADSLHAPALLVRCPQTLVVVARPPFEAGCVL